MLLQLQMLSKELSQDSVEPMEDLTQIAENLKPNVIREYFEGLLPDLLAFGIKVVLAFVIYLVGTRVIKFLRKLLRRFLERSNVDEGVKQFMDSFAKFLLYFFLIVLICGWFGVSAASVVALLGSAGLAVGLALQGSLSNFAGGVLILVIKPFKVGDYIIEDNRKNEGTVTEIQLFYTKLSTMDNKVVIIPNGILANSSLTNVTHQEKRRVDLSVGVSYQSDIRRVKEILIGMLEEERCRLQEEDMSVFVEALLDSSIKMGCRIWVKTEDYWAVKCRLMEEMKYRLDKNGIEIPYNQLEVSIKNTSK